MNEKKTGWNFLTGRKGKAKEEVFNWGDWIRNRHYERIRLDTVGRDKGEWQFKATENQHSCWVYLSLIGKHHFCSCVEWKTDEFSLVPRSGPYMCRHILAAAFQNSLEMTLIKSLGQSEWIV